MLKNRVYGFSRHPGCRAQYEHESLKFAFPKKRGFISRLHQRVSRQVKNYRISHLAKLCLPGGLFVCYVFDCLGKTSFRVFVKWQMARMDWPKRVSGYFEKMQIFPRFPVVEGICFRQAPPQGNASERVRKKRLHCEERVEEKGRITPAKTEKT